MNDPVLVTNPARPRDHGSGFVIRRLDGGAGAQVVTCAHVVRTLGADGLRVSDLPAKVVVDLAAQGIDLAVLSVEGLEDPAVELGLGTAGEEVELFGFEPAGGGPIAVPHRGKLAKRSVTALSGRNRAAWHLELTDGVIEGGHSGGPVVSVRTGHVVGVIAMGPDQQGGHDGVAVAIENLRAWKDAPVTVDSGDAWIERELAKPWWRRHWRGLVIAVASAGAAAVIAAKLAPASSAPLSACAIPDLRESYEAFAESAWCPDAIDGAESCVERFADGSVITGHCNGTEADGAWSSRDPSGVERWSARFFPEGSHPRAVLVRTTRLRPGAFERLELRRGVVAGAGTVDASTQEVTCEHQGGFASVTREKPDVTKDALSVTLLVPGGVLTCTFAGETRVCSIEEQSVTGKFADDTYKRLEVAERLIRTCNLPDLPALAQCGDGKTSADEACDTGGVDRERCDFDCTAPLCGDQHVNREAGEQCDAGMVNGQVVDTAQCNATCTLPRCGDGKVNIAAGEACDPGSVNGAPVDTATCNADCSLPRCGDGHWNKKAEPCDAGGDTRDCDEDCTKPKCGDGYVNKRASEQCDPPVLRVCAKTCKWVPGREPLDSGPTERPVIGPGGTTTTTPPTRPRPP